MPQTRILLVLCPQAAARCFSLSIHKLQSAWSSALFRDTALCHQEKQQLSSCSLHRLRKQSISLHWEAGQKQWAVPWVLTVCVSALREGAAPAPPLPPHKVTEQTRPSESRPLKHLVEYLSPRFSGRQSNQGTGWGGTSLGNCTGCKLTLETSSGQLCPMPRKLEMELTLQA